MLVNHKSTTNFKRANQRRLIFLNIVNVIISLALVLSSVSAVLAVSGQPALAASSASALSASEDPTQSAQPGGSENPPPATQKVKVPNVCGKTLLEAANILNQNGLSYEVAQGYSTYKGAVVDSTDPWGGATVDFGSTVILYPKEYENAIDNMKVGFYKYVAKTDSDGNPTLENVFVQFPDQTQATDIPWIEEKNGEIQLGLSVHWMGKSWENASGSLRQSDVMWGTSDKDIATVDEKGKVTATGKKDGEVIVTCTLKNYNPAASTTPISATIKIQVIGQSGNYPVEMVIVDENNNPYGNSDIIFDRSDGADQRNLYVRVLYSDNTRVSNAPSTDPAQAKYVNKIPGLSWAVDDTRFAYIDPFTGIVNPMPNISGKTAVTATILGGKDGAITAHTYINIKGMSSAPPSDKLAVHVYYSSDLNNEVSSKIYTAQSIRAASSTGGLVQQAYSQVGQNGDWRTVSGEGVYLKDVLADVGVTDLNSVYGLICKATDGTNNGWVPGGVLFGQTGYYFPYFGNVNSQGVHNTSGGSVAYPMIALRSYAADKSTEVHFDTMNGNNCFEILLGNHGSSNGNNSDVAMHYSIYKMYDMKIILSGSPQVEYGKNPDGGNNNQAGNGQGNGSGNKEGDGGNDGKSGTGDKIAMGLGGDATDAPAKDAAQNEGGTMSGVGNNEEAAAEELKQPDDNSARWQVFEMMSKDKNNLDKNYNNPLEPFFLPGCCAVALGGGLAARDNLKNEMGSPTWLRRRIRKLRNNFKLKGNK